jgi:hypothetical protein
MKPFKKIENLSKKEIFSFRKRKIGFQAWSGGRFSFYFGAW